MEWFKRAEREMAAAAPLGRSTEDPSARLYGVLYSISDWGMILTCSVHCAFFFYAETKGGQWNGIVVGTGRGLNMR
jgi:hypothetical protein